jgi:hypothetical protein
VVAAGIVHHNWYDARKVRNLSPSFGLGRVLEGLMLLEVGRAPSAESRAWALQNEASFCATVTIRISEVASTYFSQRAAELLPVIESIKAAAARPTTDCSTLERAEHSPQRAGGMVAGAGAAGAGRCRLVSGGRM